jgi:transposase
VTRIIGGVDISSSSLEARMGPEGGAASFANNAEGIAQLAAFCHTHHAEMVAMEATGGYEQRAFAQLSEQGLPTAILNPRAVRQFAQSMGRLEKTDAIDAGMIAWYAEVKQSLPLTLAPATQQHLRALVLDPRAANRGSTSPANSASYADSLTRKNSFPLLPVISRNSS